MPEKLRVEIAPDQEVNAFVYPVANQNQIDVTVISGAWRWRRSEQ